MVFVSIITLFGLGLVAAILLSIASRVFYVKEDPRVEAVLEVLPKAMAGTPIALIMAGLMSLAFMGFKGMAQ